MSKLNEVQQRISHSEKGVWKTHVIKSMYKRRLCRCVTVITLSYMVSIICVLKTEAFVFPLHFISFIFPYSMKVVRIVIDNEFERIEISFAQQLAAFQFDTDSQTIRENKKL